MNEKVSIACPSCQKGYSVPANLGNRRLKCKACGSDFQLSDVLRSPVAPVAPATPVPVPVGQFSTFDSVLGTGGIAGSNPYDQLSPPSLGRIEYRKIEHRKNSKMLLAIVGSILGCLLIIPACYAINVAITSAFAKTDNQRLNRKKDVSVDRSDSNSILVAAKWPQQSTASLSWKSE